MSELNDLTALIRANTPLIVIETQEEARVVDVFRQALSQVWRALYRWSITEGLRRIDMDREDEPEGAPDASAALQAMKQADQRGIYLLLDFHPYLGYPGSQRQLRDIVQRRHCQPHVVVLVGAKIELPEDLEALAVRFSPRLPDANALLKMVREEAADYMSEHGGCRVDEAAVAQGHAQQQDRVLVAAEIEHARSERHQQHRGHREQPRRHDDAQHRGIELQARHGDQHRRRQAHVQHHCVEHFGRVGRKELQAREHHAQGEHGQDQCKCVEGHSGAR